MGLSESHNTSAENHENGTNQQQNNLVSTLTDETIISAQEHKERFASAPKMLQDTFTLQEDGSFLVKTPEESKVME